VTDIPEQAVDAAMAALIARQREARDVVWASPSRDQVRAMIRGQWERAEAAEARLAEVRQAIATFFTVYGNSTAASLTRAGDLGEGIRQILDRDALEALGSGETGGET
jgi:hypothetical protein